MRFYIKSNPSVSIKNPFSITHAPVFGLEVPLKFWDFEISLPYNKKSPPFHWKASHWLLPLVLPNLTTHNIFKKCGLDVTRTREPMRDRHVF